ncbi:EF-hand calcium-binding domain-containing protein 1 isoform X2 [Drosophila eugracilis]|uniref:EF-hand calcium-binding domain-containing protein 1 isoform X2 n=1 Tax=Drosophila eugracilis TaxID=29029 RepID=UPI0007E71722|nr:EF-hand calcium-binding domain-containing protein 1 isoform X2 [Drosophila eugracilis]
MNRIDLTLDDMANNKFLTLYSSMIKNFTTSTDFSSTEVVSLLIVFYKYALSNRSRVMSTSQLYNLFLVIFGIFDVTIIERIAMNITLDGRSITPDSWIRLFRVFFTGTLHERMKFAFEVYTSAGTVVLNREVVGLAIENFFSGDDEDEDMCEFLFEKFDTDKDGVIGFEEYSEIVQKQPALLEFLGKIFPDDKDRSLVAYCHNIESMFPPDIY